jgi:hypothetical protein
VGKQTGINLSFFETKERNLFIADYLNCDIENLLFNEKHFYFIVSNHELGKQLSSLIELDPNIITAEFLEVLENMSKEKYYKKISFRIKPSSQIISSEVLKLLLSRGYCSQLSFTSLLDLNQPVDILWSNLRKSFKSIINKETKRTSIKFYDSLSSDISLFNNWISLYSNAIRRGGKELSNTAINSMHDAIKNNMGFVITAYENETLLGAMLFNYYNHSAYYSAAANSDDIESCKDRYIGHFLMWEGIKKLKSFGSTELEVGPLEFENQLYCQSDLKLQNITNFKLGFGGNIVPVYNFTKSI